MKSRIIKILFISLLFSTKISPAAEMKKLVEDIPLIRAIKQNASLEYIKSLAKGKANVNEKDEAQCNATPLMYASEYERPDVVDFLLKQNANVDDVTDCGHTVFCFARDPKIEKNLKNAYLKKADVKINDDYIVVDSSSEDCSISLADLCKNKN